VLIDCNKAFGKAFRRKLQDKKRDKRILGHLMRTSEAVIEETAACMDIA
jgi:hypothetical protein